MRIALRFKILFAVIFTTTVVFSCFLIFNNNQLHKIAFDIAGKRAVSNALSYATTCKNYIDSDMGYTKAIANATQHFQQYNNEYDRDSAFSNMYLNMLKRNPKYISVWNTLEFRFTDTSYKYDYGRKSIVAFRSKTGYQTTTLLKDLTGHNKTSAYYQMKIKGKPAVMEPYVDPTVGEMLITSLTWPIEINEEFAGQGGIDIPLTAIQEFVDDLQIPNKAFAMVLTNAGAIIGHSNKEQVGKNVSGILDDINIQLNYSSFIEVGKEMGLSHFINGEEFHTAIVPFTIVGTDTPWAFSLTLPIAPFTAEAKAKGKNIIWIGIFGMIFIYVVIWLLATKIFKPLYKTTKIFKELAAGNISEKFFLNIKTKDELEELSLSVNNLISSLIKTKQFAKEIEEGNLDAKFELHGENDQLGNALLNMQSGLIELKKQEEIRLSEDKRRNWALDGLAKFTEYIRLSTKLEFAELMQLLLNNLVRYTESVQGGIYLVNTENEEKKTLDLVASYGFNSEKFNKKTLEYGEGLVGVCINDLKTICLNKVPENYISVTSGLGEEKPSSIILVPLKHDDKVSGVIELSFFSSIASYQQKFIEDVSENIAAMITSMQLKVQASKLLAKSKEQADSLIANEEELRQTMEEMQATQEEKTRTIEHLEQELRKANQARSKKNS